MHIAPQLRQRGGSWVLRLLVVAIVAALLRPPAARAATGPELLTHGSSKSFWFADVEHSQDPTQPDQTVIFGRTAGSAGNWDVMNPIPGRVVALADDGTDLLALGQDGHWALVEPTENRSGEDVPGGGAILAMCGGSGLVWAIAPELAPIASTNTSDSTRPATQATTAPLHRLFQLDHGNWSALGPALPDEAFAPDAGLCMATVDRLPAVAWLAGGAIHIRTFSPTDSAWHDAGNLVPPSPVVDFKLIGMGDSMFLWAAGAQGPGVLFTGGPHWSAPINLKNNGTGATDSSAGTERAVAVAMDRFRFIWKGTDSKIYEQVYDITGRPIEAAAPIVLQKTIDEGPLGAVNLIILIVAMVLAFAALYVRGAAVPGAPRVPIVPAPMGPRLLAGMIDAAPLIVVFVYIARTMPENYTTLQQITARYTGPFMVAMAVYVLHTMICELAMGVSIGKLLAGLKVVRLDGSPPKAWQIILRNFERTVDVQLLFPLVSVLVSPMRQRVGDWVAGTVVVVDEEKPKDPA